MAGFLRPGSRKLSSAMKRRYLLTTESEASPEAIAAALRALLPDASLEPMAEEPPGPVILNPDATDESRRESLLAIKGLWKDRDISLEDLRAKLWG